MNFSLSSSIVHVFIAETIVQELGDMELARQVLKQSETLAEEISDITCLADSIRFHLKDENWYTLLMAKANSMVKNCRDVLILNSDYSEN